MHVLASWTFLPLCSPHSAYSSSAFQINLVSFDWTKVIDKCAADQLEDKLTLLGEFIAGILNTITQKTGYRKLPETKIVTSQIAAHLAHYGMHTIIYYANHSNVVFSFLPHDQSANILRWKLTKFGRSNHCLCISRNDWIKTVPSLSKFCSLPRTGWTLCSRPKTI